MNVGQDGGPGVAPMKVAGSWRTILPFRSKSNLFMLVLAVFLSAAAALLQPAMAVIFGRFFQAFSDYASGQTDGSVFMERSLDSVFALLGIGLCTLFFKGGLFTSWLMFGEMQARTVRELLFQALLDRDARWYDEQTIGVETLLARFQTHIQELQLGTSQPLGLSILGIVQMLCSLGLAFRTNWMLTLVVLSAVPVIVMGVALLSMRTQKYIKIRNLKSTQTTKVANNSITNVKMIKCFNTQEQEWEQYHLAVQEFTISFLKEAVFSAMQTGFVRFAGTTMFVQGFWFGGTQVHSGKTTAGEVITTFWACLIATKSFEDILPHLVVLQRAQASAISLMAVVNKVYNGPKDDELSPQYCDGEIELRSVSFAYPARPDQPVLQNCSLHFPYGQTTFIIGRSGSGKSTVGQLLLKFYAAQNGTVMIDGHDLQGIKTSWIRNNFTLVQQQTLLFSETISRNIALGHHDHSLVTASQVSRCLKVADLQDTIEALPEGVYTRVGHRGSSLSGGQKQRVAIARARLRDTPVLILDEATSALDCTSRAVIMQEIRRWRRNKTTIIITHDLAQIQWEEAVYVLDKGRVIFKGRRGDIGGLHRQFDTGLDQSQPGFETDHSCSHRRDLFNTGVGAMTEDETVPSCRRPNNSRIWSQQLKKGLSASMGAVLQDLKQQALAKAHAMYVLGRDQPQAGSMHNRSPIQKVGGRISTYMGVLMPITRIPESASKPLPVPPLMLELADRNESDDHATTKGTAAVTEEGYETYSTMAILTTVWPALRTPDRVRLVAGLVATLCHAAASAAFSYTLVQVFGTYSLATGYREKASVYSIAVLGIAVADGVASFLMQYLLACVSQSWVNHLTLTGMKVILRRPKGWFDEEKNTPAALISCLDGSVEEIKDLVGRYVAHLVVVAVMMVVAVVWSFVTCWKLTSVSLAATPVLYLLTRCFKSISTYWEARTNDACEQISNIYVDAFADIKTVRSLTLESYFHSKYHHAAAEAFSVGRRRAVISGVFFGLSDSAIVFFTPLIFWYGARLARDREWPVGSILVVFSLLLFCTANASAVVAWMPQISSAHNAANRLLCLIRAPVDSHEDTGEIQLNEDGSNTLFGPIHFINLTFSYPTRPEVEVLRRLNLTIPPGKCTAIVGASGSGKSTITSLILGLYPPGADRMALSSPTGASGGPPSLTLAGRDIRTLDLARLRSLIALVPQSPVLLPTTVRGNISYGLSPDSPLVSAFRIEAAARLAGIHEFIQSLPQGYATIVGDGGLGMSGGQAQRIVIARALVRNPSILILDEATSALDGESATVIRSSVQKVAQQKKPRLTVIMVTHAREMMAFADHVVVLGQGSVVEQGSFLELLSRRAALWDMLHAGERE